MILLYFYLDYYSAHVDGISKRGWVPFSHFSFSVMIMTEHKMLSSMVQCVITVRLMLENTRKIYSIRLNWKSPIEKKSSWKIKFIHSIKRKCVNRRNSTTECVSCSSENQRFSKPSTSSGFWFDHIRSVNYSQFSFPINCEKTLIFADKRKNNGRRAGQLAKWTQRWVRVRQKQFGAVSLLPPVSSWHCFLRCRFIDTPHTNMGRP